MKRREFMSLSRAALSAPAAMARRPLQQKTKHSASDGRSAPRRLFGCRWKQRYTNSESLPSGKRGRQIGSASREPSLPIEEIRAEDLSGWDSEDQSASRAFGDLWHDQRRTAVVLVPSVA